MDLAYWGFHRWPFQRTFSSERFFLSSTHDEALARLLFLIEESRRVGLVVGARGTGKTFLLKVLQRRAERLGFLAVRCESLGNDARELIGQIADGLAVPWESDSPVDAIWNGLRKKLDGFMLVNQRLLILIDHFDSVEFSAHHAVCRLLQLADSIGAKLTVIVATQGGAIPFSLLDAAELRIDLSAWSASETASFINSSIGFAGHSGHIFTDEALTSVYQFSKGIPAVVTSICNVALLAARGRDELLVTSELIEAAACELPSRSTIQLLNTSAEQG